jgi:hypothetical protein
MAEGLDHTSHAAATTTKNRGDLIENDHAADEKIGWPWRSDQRHLSGRPAVRSGYVDGEGMSG